MRGSCSLLLLLLVVRMSIGQTITQAEYFIDTDPGVGEGISINISNPSNTIDLSDVAIPTEGLDTGVHRACFRIKDNSGKWSLSECRTFNINPVSPPKDPPIIVAAEYFIGNEDPGKGNALPLEIGEPSEQVSVRIARSTEELGLEDGEHTITLRMKDSHGNWSFNHTRTFKICNTAVANFGVQVDELAITLSDNSINANTYAWDFGDSNTSNQKTVEHIYTAEGTYQVCLTVTSDCNNDTQCQEVLIGDFPTELESQIVAGNKVQITWKDNSEDETGFEIERSEDETSGYIPIHTTGANEESFIDDDPNLQENTTYYYRIRKITDTGVGAFVLIISIQIPYMLSTPTNLTASATSNTFISLTWQINSIEETGFAIERSLSEEGGFIAIDTVENGISAFIDTQLSPETTYYYRIKALGNEDIMDSEFTTVVSATTLAPEVLSISPKDSPALIEAGFTTVVSAEVKHPELAFSIRFHYKGISALDWQTATPENAEIGIYSYNLDETIDPIGVQYYFAAIGADEASVLSTSPKFIHIDYSGTGLNFPILKPGIKATDYHLISVPLNLSNGAIATVFDELGGYDIKKWRLFRVENGEYQEFRTSGFNGIETGRGYLLAMAKLTSISTGSGTTRVVPGEDTLEINLQQGWNMIGNPFNFDLSWSKISAFNTGKSISDFMIFNKGAYSSGNTLERFGGGIVFAEAPLVLEIPVKKALNSGARITEEHKKNNRLGQDHWEINLTLNSGAFQNELGGIGMHPEAQTGKDPWDGLAPPRFIQYLETVFHHPEFFYPYFTKDVVPTSEKYVWEFTTVSNLPQASKTLTWDNTFSLSGDKILILYHTDQNKLINMQSVAQYSFSDEGLSHFKIYFGPENELSDLFAQDEWFVGDPYPNPASGSVAIPFLLPAQQKDFQVTLTLMDATGKTIQNISDYTFENGYFQIVWDRSGNTGNPISKGLYFYHLKLITPVNKRVVSGKILLN